MNWKVGVVDGEERCAEFSLLPITFPLKSSPLSYFAPPVVPIYVFEMAEQVSGKHLASDFSLQNMPHHCQLI